MEKVKYRFSFFGVSETVSLKGLYLNMMKVKQGSEEFLKPFLIVSQHREIAGIFLFSGFIPALTGCHFRSNWTFLQCGFFPCSFSGKTSCLSEST